METAPSAGHQVVSSLRFRADSADSGSNYRAVAAAACKESEGDQWTYWMNYWATSYGGRGRCADGTSELDIGLFLSKKSEHRTSAIIPESAELYYSPVKVIFFYRTDVY